MIASKIWGLVAFLAALLAVAVGAETIMRRTPKSTHDLPQSKTVLSTSGRAPLMRRNRKFTGDTPQNIAVDSVGRAAEESVGGFQQGTNALLQINAQGDVINTGSEGSLNSKNSASVVKMSSINGIANNPENHKNTYRLDNINGRVAVTSMEDVTGEYDHGSVSAPSLCHEEIVSDMCMALNVQTKEYYNTETDADTSIVHAAEIAEQLSASKASVLNFLNEIGVTNLETDKHLLDHGAFAVKCMDLCLKTVDSIPEHLRPPTSDVACVSSADPVAAPDCNIDVSPKALDAITDAHFHPVGDETHGDSEGGLKEADKDHAFEATEKDKNGINEILDQQNEDKSFEQLQVDVALLFRIHPVANVSFDMDDDKNISDEPHFLDAEHASRTHFLNISFLDRLGNARMSQKATSWNDIPRLNNIARAWLSSTVNKMAGGRANDLVRKWFRSSDRNTVNAARRTIDSAVLVLSNVYYKKGWMCYFNFGKMKNVAGYVQPYPPLSKRYGFWGPYVVNLCDLWANNQWESGKVHTLVHEAMHHYSAWEDDELYGCSESLRLSGQRALNNADNFAFFAMEAHGERLC